MATPTDGALRVARAAALTFAVLGLAITAHRAAGGALPGPVVLATSAGAVLLQALLLTQRRLGVPSVVGGLAFGQVALHLVFTAATDPAGATTAPIGHLGHAVAPGPAPAATSVLTTTADLTTTSVLTTTADLTTTSDLATTAGHALSHHGGAPGMLLGHLVATVLLAALLLHGETTLWRLVARLAPGLVRLLGEAPEIWVAAGRPHPGTRSRRTPRNPRLRCGPLRGPPVTVGA